MKRKAVIMSLVVLSIFLFVGCGKDLSKDAASEKIKQGLRPITINVRSDKIENSWYRSKTCNDCYSYGLGLDVYEQREDAKQKFNKLTQDGYIKSLEIIPSAEKWKVISKDKSVSTIAPFSEYVKFELTEKAKSYVDGGGERGWIKIKIAEVEKVTIVALSEPVDFKGKKVREVKYIATYKPTVFWGALIKGEKQQLEKQGEAIFALYDSGWELEKR